jgi:glutaryl-CoA dehydrogenase
MRAWDIVGAFGLTEPDVGSGVARGLTTTCRRTGDTWVLNGQKKWIGNSTWCDIVVIWARDEADDTVKGFIVRTTLPGYSAELMQGKIAQRTVHNGLITLK